MRSSPAPHARSPAPSSVSLCFIFTNTVLSLPTWFHFLLRFLIVPPFSLKFPANSTRATRRALNIDGLFFFHSSLLIAMFRKLFIHNATINGDGGELKYHWEDLRDPERIQFLKIGIRIRSSALPPPILDSFFSLGMGHKKELSTCSALKESDAKIFSFLAVYLHSLYVSRSP